MSDTHLLMDDGTPIPHLGEAVIIQAPPGWPTSPGEVMVALVTAVRGDGTIGVSAKRPGIGWMDLDIAEHGANPGEWRTVAEWERDR